jgi:hypothetical protein
VDVEEFKKFNDRLFFISDIRSLEYEKGFQGVEEYERKNEELAMEDMNLQMKWVQELKPVQSLLKFRLPYEYKWTNKNDKYFLYLDGDLFKQAWSAPTSTETRIVPNLSITPRNWDFREYESMMFYQNNVIREHISFINPLTNINEPICLELGLTQDYDSTLFVITIKEYLDKYNADTSPEAVLKLCKAIIEDIGKGVVSIGGLRSGAINEANLIIDGLNTFLRAFCMINHINPAGAHIGGLTGFLKSVGYAIESMVFTRDKQVALGIPPGIVPEGWWVGFQITSDAVWQKILSREYKGFSIQGRVNYTENEIPTSELGNYDLPGKEDNNG